MNIGVNFVLRKLGNSAKPNIEMRKNGNQYTLVTESTFKNTETVFELGKEFDEETFDGRKVKSVFTMDGDNKFIQVQVGEKETTDIVREFGETELICTMKVKDVVCVRRYSTA